MKVGDTVDYLTLIKYTPCGSSGHKRGLFRCECGNEIDRLISGIKKPGFSLKSCGCKKRHKKTGGHIAKSYGFANDLAHKFITGRL